MGVVEARRKLVFALDVDTLEDARSWVDRLRGRVGLFKVGKQLFTRCGPDVVRMIREQGGEVFLDLKFHDIPNTVAKACHAAGELGARIVTLHTLGGMEMMRAASQAVGSSSAEGGGRPLLLGVTILTSSTDETLRRVGIDRPVAEMVPRLALLAQEAGLDGVVASPHEVFSIRRRCDPQFVVLTPGVRTADARTDDQRRVATPSEAIRAGANYLVVGRPIATARDPEAVVERLVQEMADALDAHE